MELPDAEAELDTRRFQITSDDYGLVVQEVKGLLYDREYYQMVFDPWQVETAEALYGSMSDDLADIWRDLKVGLLAMDAGNLANAIADWRFSFRCHWGCHHATHVLRPLLGIVLENEGA